jgi:hypothetical protein
MIKKRKQLQESTVVYSSLQWSTVVYSGLQHTTASKQEYALKTT